METGWWNWKWRILTSNSLAVVLTLTTLGISATVGKRWPEELALSLFLVPILVCAYLGGLWPGLLTDFLSCLLSDYFLLEPRHSFRVASPLSELYLAELAGIGLLITVLIQLLHQRRADDPRARSDDSLRVAERRIWLSSVAALALLVAIAISSYHEVEALRRGDAWVDHTHQVISSIRRVQSLVIDAIATQSGYVITGDEQYLRPYTATLKGLETELSILRPLISDNRDQGKREQKLEGYISDRLSVLRGVAELRRTQGLSAAQAAITSGEGRQLEQIIDDAAGEMERQEWLLLRGRQDQAQKTDLYCRRIIVVGSLLAFGIVAAALSLIGQDFAGSHRASRELRESRDHLERRVLERTADLEESNKQLREQAALLDLAHDAIILRSLHGRIGLWSRGATDTYGFTAEEALGRVSHELLKTVFPTPLEDIQSYIEQTREWEGELSHTRRDGRLITVTSRWSLLRDEQGNPTEIMEINRDITERKKAEEALRKIEWMLTEKKTEAPQQGETLRSSTTSLPPYGDLTELNSCKLILDSVGRPLLQEITSDFMDLLGTSATIFEKNGDYAFGALSSTWCRSLDNASRGLCNSSDNSEALGSGFWLCRESCWNQSACLAIQSGEPGDVECDGGLRIYAVPIRAGTEIIGSMSFGYGDPPREESKLRELAAKYRVSVEELRRQAQSYESRPAFIIEMAKKRLETAASLIGEIVQRKRVEGELEQKAKDLAKSNDELAQFAYVASHDLQEPLRKIGAFGDRLAAHSESVLDEQGRDYLHRMQNAAQRMSNLIESLLELSRVTSKARALEMVDLNKVVSDALSDLELRIQQTGGRVEVDQLPTVMADRLQMRQLFQNLIGNALKFHKEDTSPVVRIHTQQNGKGTWEVHVTDNGIGFDEQYLARIFRPFQRLHARSAFEGSGIGLAICNKIVARHLGQITAHSQPGIGSDFIVLLPRTPIAKEAKASWK